MRARVLLEEADALIDVLRVPVDGRHRDAGEVVREEARVPGAARDEGQRRGGLEVARPGEHGAIRAHKRGVHPSLSGVEHGEHRLFGGRADGSADQRRPRPDGHSRRERHPGGRGEPEVRTLKQADRVTSLDAISGPDGVHVAWVERHNLLSTLVFRAKLPKGELGFVEAAGDAGHEVRFAAGPAGQAPALVVSTLDEAVVAVDGNKKLGELGGEKEE